MLKLLRKKGVAKKVIWIVAIVIIISFGFLGTAYLITGNSQVNYAGKIFGKKVEIDEFNTVFSHVRIQAIMKYGDKFKEVQQYLNLDNETWDRLILLREVKKRKIKVPNEDVVKAIESIPFFQRDGQFDSLLYNDIIRFAFRIKPRDFEESMRDTLKFSRLFEEITADVTIDENIVRDQYQRLNEKVQISYVLFSPSQYTSEVVSDENKALEYYNANKLSFISPPSINVEYFEFPLPKDAPETASPEETTAIIDEQDTIRQKAELVYEDLLINDNFPEVAKEHSLEAKQTGFFNEESPNLSLGWSFEILNEVFKLNTDQIAGPFEANDKLFIVKIIDKKDESIPTFEEAKEKVINAYKTQEARIIAENKANEFLERIRPQVEQTPTAGFASIIEPLNLEVNQTPVFNRGQYLPKIGISKDFQEAAFALSETNKVSSVVSTEAGACILYLDSYIPASEEEYQNQRQELAERILNEKRGIVFGDYLTKLRAEAKLEDNIAKLKAQQAQL